MATSAGVNGGKVGAMTTLGPYVRFDAKNESDMDISAPISVGSKHG